MERFFKCIKQMQLPFLKNQLEFELVSWLGIWSKISIICFKKYFIDCRCRRCLDITDFETHGNSLLCSKCPEGNHNPPEWKCTKCQLKFDKPLEITEKATNEAIKLFKVEIKKIYYGRLVLIHKRMHSSTLSYNDITNQGRL